MRYTVIRSEKSVGELAEKIYGRLSEEDREKVVAVLLKENPGLKNFRAVKKGTLVGIPFVKGKGRRRKDKRDDPRQKATDFVVESVDTYARYVDDDFKAHEKRLKERTAVLKDSRVKKAIRELKLTDLAGHADKNIKKRLEESADEQKRTKKAMMALQKQVGALDEIRG